MAEHDTPEHTERWRDIYELSPLGIELYDGDGRLIDANRACLEIFGVRDVTAISGFSLFDDPNLDERHKAELRAGRSVSQEIAFDFSKVTKRSLYPTSRRGMIHLDLNITPFGPSVDRSNGYIVYIRDITLRRHAEAMLVEQKKFAEEVVDKSAVATFVLARNHTIILWNRACEELTGVRSTAMIGTSNQWKPFYTQQRPTLADIVLDDARETVPRLYARSGRSTLMPDGIRGEGWYANLNGKDRYIVFDAAPLHDTRGLLMGAIETLHDMTDFRRAEEDLERKTTELMRSNEELEHFAHIASHDLKAPLMSIGGFADMLQNKYADRLDEKGRSFLSRIIEGTARMEQLTSDLLTYARVTSRARPFERVSTASVLEEALSNLKAAIDESRATVTVDELPAVTGDRTQLVQLFQNLIGNAIKYRGEAVPAIRIAAVSESNRKPAGTERAAGEAWMFSVSDNGIGIEPRYSREIFEIFRRVPSREQTHAGTGIGLAICKKIVERHNGRIWVESEPGRGSTFFFTVPREKTAAP